MRFFSGKRKRTSELRIIFDLGSGSVGCAVATLRGKKQKPTMHFATRAAIPAQEQFDYDRFKKGTFAAFKEVGEKAKRYLSQSQSFGKVNTVAVVLSSPWYVAQTNDIVHKQEEEFSVSSKLIQEVLDAHESAQPKGEPEMLKQRGITDPSIFERRILGIALNGYSADAPLKKTATNMKLSMFTATMSRAFYQELRNVVTEEFGQIELDIHSHVLAVFTTIRDCFGPQGDFLLLDVGREVSEVALSLNDVLLNSTTIPIGATTIIEQIAKEKNITEKEVLSLIVLSGKGENSLNSKSKEGLMLQAQGVEWRRAVLHALQKTVGGQAYPRNLFLTAPSELLPWFQDVLEQQEQEQEQNAPTIKVTPLLSCLTQSFVDANSVIEVDTMLAIEALHIARI